MEQIKHTKKTIVDYINKVGAKRLLDDKTLFETQKDILSKQDTTGELSTYFQICVRYQCMKAGFITPQNNKNKGDLLLFKKGPDYIMRRKEEIKKEKEIKKKEEEDRIKLITQLENKYADYIKEIDEYIQRRGVVRLHNDNPLYVRVKKKLLSEDPYGYLGKYFQLCVRYQCIKAGLIAPKRKGDLRLVENGPKYIISRSTFTLEEKCNTVDKVEKRKNAKKYKALIPLVKRNYIAKYPFKCSICGERKKGGAGFATHVEEFFLCNECIKTYSIDIIETPRIYSTPMGGDGRYRVRTRRK